MTEQRDSGARRQAQRETMIDLTGDRAVSDAAQMAVEELHADFGGGPWSICGLDGAVIAATGLVDDVGTTPIPFSAPGLSLRVGDSSERPAADLVDDPRCRASVERLGSLLTKLIEAQRRAVVAEARAADAERLAMLDALTGLIDQGEWWRRVGVLEDQLGRRPRPTVIAVIDLDGLKDVNDTHGHLRGDLLIKQAALTLTAAVRRGDLVARIGGDEFAVLALDHDAQPEVLQRRLSTALAANGVQSSVGTAAYPAHPTLQAAFAAADRAMYVAKAAHRRSRTRPPD